MERDVLHMVEMAGLVTNKSPDEDFSRPRLAVFVLASQNKNIAAAFNSRRT
jgi:hypothetical protein